jgi:hypothetical protein
MASLVRRLATLTTRDSTQATLTVARLEGNIVFTQDEVQRYGWLFQMLDRFVVSFWDVNDMLVLLPVQYSIYHQRPSFAVFQ